MNTEHDDFARQNPALDQALREQLKAPVMDTAFRRQVMARIAGQRAALELEALAPRVAQSRLRAQGLLQLMNWGAVALVVALLFRVSWPWLIAYSGLAVPAASLLRSGLLPVSIAVAAAALLYGLQRARLLGWVRRLDI